MIAGRILIMPKGAYDKTVTYEALDLVRYNGTSWLAKKTVLGVEPTDANDEYWQNMFSIEHMTHTIEETLTFKGGVAEFTYDLSGIGECQNVLVTAIDFEDAYCVQISSMDQGNVTIKVTDITDSTAGGDVKFKITYFLE